MERCSTFISSSELSETRPVCEITEMGKKVIKTAVKKTTLKFPDILVDPCFALKRIVGLSTDNFGISCVRRLKFIKKVTEDQYITRLSRVKRGTVSAVFFFTHFDIVNCKSPL